MFSEMYHQIQKPISQNIPGLKLIAVFYPTFLTIIRKTNPPIAFLYILCLLKTVFIHSQFLILETKNISIFFKSKLMMTNPKACFSKHSQWPPKSFRLCQA
uniref:Uncharacterized protein n=1 Tax=Populus davidiana TaxID=266767 RepID=A0A6M2EKN5_9ROSI